jgi:hypothetical protein
MGADKFGPNGYFGLFKLDKLENEKQNPEKALQRLVHV